MAHTRRAFLKQAAFTGAGLAVAGGQALASPLILTSRRARPGTVAGTLVFRPYYVQRGMGPHLDATYAYASDTKWDAFHSNIKGSPEAGLTVSDTEGQPRF